MEENLWIFAAALDGGYICLSNLVAWADQQVLRIDNPPRWLLDLCLAKNEQEASGVIWMECHRNREATGLEWLDPASYGDLQLGFLFLRFERGDLTMARLLELAGEHADAPVCSVCCETFYHLLNEIDGGGPIIPSDEPLETRVAWVFAPMVALTNQLVRSLPGSLFGVENSDNFGPRSNPR